MGSGLWVWGCSWGSHVPWGEADGDGDIPPPMFPISQFGNIEGITTAILDEFPALREWRRKALFLGALCISFYLLGLLLITQVRRAPAPPSCSTHPLGWQQGGGRGSASSPLGPPHMSQGRRTEASECPGKGGGRGRRC